MTSIVKIPRRFVERPTSFKEHQEKFEDDLRKSQIATYSVEYFSDCFNDIPRTLKSAHVKLYQFQGNNQTKVKYYSFSWEDLSRTKVMSWDKFRVFVDEQIKAFLENLKEKAQTIEGSLE
ncbi:hypothetical protein EU523_01470 [Candidatus Heimdallarchaeota archaeon]|jgi:hypothetical protein|nr:MAG: hypothetical protein EU523_01470 [Candidatus Heimdallarchaeota archaeon]